MKRRIVLLLVVLVSVGWVPRIQAQDGCSTPVVDEAGIFGGNQLPVEQAVATLAAQTGAIVRVRTFTDADLSSIQVINSTIVARCTDWQAYNGELNNDYIVFLLAREQRATTLVYGTRWAPMLDTQWERIVDGVNTYFRSAQFADGFVYGIGETGRVIDLTLHPPTLAPRPTALPATAVAPPSSPQPLAQGTQLDGRSVLLILGVIVAAAAVVGAIILILLLYRRWQYRLRQLTEATTAQNEAADLFAELFNRIGVLLKNITNGKATMTARRYEELVAAQGRLDDLLDDPNGLLSHLNDSFGLPLRDNLSAADAEAAAQGYRRATSQLMQVRTAVEALEQALVQHTQDMAAASGEAAVLETLLTDSLRVIAGVAEAGYRVTDQHDLITGLQTGDLLTVKQLVTEHDYAAARSQIATLTERANAIVADAQAIRTRHQELQRLAGEYPGRLEQLKDAITTGLATFTGLTERYAETCWKAVRGNGTEAENRVEWIATALPALVTAITLESQDWERAEALNTDIVKWFGEAESFMRSIAALERELGQAAASAGTELDELDADIRTAEMFIEQHDADIDEELERRLAAAKRQAHLARQALQADRPDYLEIVRLVKAADGEVDTIAQSAADQFNAADRLRKKAAKALRDAETEVSEAAEYIEDHEDDVRGYAKQLLHDAQQLLQRATEETDLEQQAQTAQSAQEKAEQALDEAEDDVEDAEDARRPSYSSGYSGWGSISSTPTRPTTSINFGGFSSSSPATGGGTVRWSAPAPKTGGGTKGW